MSGPTPEEIIAQRGWQLEDSENGPALRINGHSVRYYAPPPEKYDIHARLMIIRNTRAELELLLAPEHSPGSHLSIKELEKHKNAINTKLEEMGVQLDEQHRQERLAIAERMRSGAFFKEQRAAGDLEMEFLADTAKRRREMPKKRPKAIPDALSTRCDSYLKVLTHIDFQLGLLQAEQYLEHCKNGDNPADHKDLLANACKNINAGAHTLNSTRATIAGHSIKQEDYRFYYELADNMKALVDLATPVNDIIFDWYEKMASNMEAIDLLAHKFQTFGGSLYNIPEDQVNALPQKAYDLLQARRNEPEYSLALAEFRALVQTVKDGIRPGNMLKDDASDVFDMEDEHDKKFLRKERHSLVHLLDDISLIARTREIPPSLKQHSRVYY